jgi:hypothetical protein
VSGRKTGIRLMQAGTKRAFRIGVLGLGVIAGTGVLLAGQSHPASNTLPRKGSPARSRTGQIVIKSQFDDAHEFADGLAPVKLAANGASSIRPASMSSIPSSMLPMILQTDSRQWQLQKVLASSTRLATSSSILNSTLPGISRTHSRQ